MWCDLLLEEGELLFADALEEAQKGPPELLYGDLPVVGLGEMVRKVLRADPPALVVEEAAGLAVGVQHLVCIRYSQLSQPIDSY